MRLFSPVENIILSLQLTSSAADPDQFHFRLIKNQAEIIEK